MFTLIDIIIVCVVGAFVLGVLILVLCKIRSLMYPDKELSGESLYAVSGITRSQSFRDRANKMMKNNKVGTESTV